MNRCSICFGTLEGDTKQLQCGHQDFHWYCVVNWLKRNPTCPICRCENDTYFNFTHKCRTLCEAIYWASFSKDESYERDFEMFFVEQITSFRPINVKCELFHTTPLHVASEWGHIKALKAIIKFMKNDGFSLDVLNDRGMTAMELAIMLCHPEIIEILKKGFNFQ